MGKFVIVIFTLCFLASPTMAAGWTARDRVPVVGNIIVKKNSLSKTIKFEPILGTPNNQEAIEKNTVKINLADIDKAENDSEVAYILSKELGDVIVKNIISKNKRPASYDKNAMSFDLMINSGYNPLAGIAYLSKTTKTSTALEAYNYLSYNYPSKIRAEYKNNEYNSFLNSIEPELDEIRQNSRKRDRFNKTQTKYTIKRFKQIAKYNEKTNPLAKWNLTYELLLSITEPEE